MKVGLVEVARCVCRILGCRISPVRPGLGLVAWLEEFDAPKQQPLKSIHAAAESLDGPFQPALVVIPGSSSIMIGWRVHGSGRVG